MEAVTLDGRDIDFFDAPGGAEVRRLEARLRDRRLSRLAELVHEADLRDGKYAHEEARGIATTPRKA